MSIVSQESTAAKTSWLQWISVWGIAIIPAYFLTGFFSNFYPSFFQFIVLSLFFQLCCIAAAFLLLGEYTREETTPDWLAILILFLALALSISAVIISWQFPGLFQRRILFMDAAKLVVFFVLLFISIAVSIYLISTRDQSEFWGRLKQTYFSKFIQDNRPGVLLTIFFLFTYFVFTQSINFPQFRTLDQYFDTDISVWLQRLTSQTRGDVSMVRAVHPAILLFLRPPVWLLSLFLHGDRLQAVFVMNALAGAGCVLLTWLIVKRASGNTTYSLLIAALLGASASHVLLSSMFETYIYSALALLLFIFLLQKEDMSLRSTVPAGIVIFGITVTNIIQSCILYFFKQPRIKIILTYVLIVGVVVAGLNVLQVWLYPNARSLFVPSNLMHEQRYVFNPFDFSWRAMGRMILTVRAVLLYGIVAPTPFILTKELGMDVPNFRTYQILLGEFHVAGYRGLADVTVKYWIVILGIALALFLLDFLKSPKQMLFPLSLLLCLGFSLALHLVYGDDPMLYSPNWVYALVLFVGFALQKWANRRWLQIPLMFFLILLISTNLGLIYQIMKVSAPFYSVGN